MIDVLVVDDDFMVARVNRRFVDAVDGFRVVGMAHTGEHAVTAVAELRPHLVLLDLYLPDIFGLEVIARLRAEGHDCDVLVISAAREVEAVRGAARHGVVGYLLKPFEAADLRVRLTQYSAQKTAPAAPLVSGQAEVDRFLALTRTPTGTVTLPKGMSVETAELVENALRAAGDTMSAAECAALVGVSRVSARRYLEHFVTTGRVSVSLRYGSAGRPERRYRWTA
ncbi:Response regulator of citrate/malate metabolism [Sinosporangium album]|uniref:Transcriptional regulatory protein n=1 Tax=Sinosporangium album TaxID=504805 RepID=A0A1G8LK17_9ACTN|nr:response regulator [Sinosporangium album]SDI55807.1 Response regulator of citrate/malate metabolism [Sinosporangium album]